MPANMKNHVSKLLLTSIVMGLSIFVLFLAQVYLAKILGITEFGKLMSIYGQYTILSGLVNFGTDRAASKFGSIYFTETKPLPIWSFLTWSIFAQIFVMFCITMMAKIAGPKFSGNFDLWAVMTIMLWSFTRFFAAMLRSMQFTFTSVFVDRLLREGILLLYALYCFFYGFRVDQDQILNIVLLGVVLSLLLGIFPTLMAMPSLPLRNSRDVFSFFESEWLTTTAAFWLIGLVELTTARFEIIYYEYVGRAENAGIFAVALLISSLVSLPIFALTILFQPAYGAFSQLKDRKKLARLVHFYSFLISVPSIVLALVIVAFPSIFFMVFGISNPSHDAIFCMQLLTLSRLLVAPFSTANVVMIMSGLHNNFLVAAFLAFATKALAIYTVGIDITLVQTAMISVIFFLSSQIYAFYIVKSKLGFYPGIGLSFIRLAYRSTRLQWKMKKHTLAC